MSRYDAVLFDLDGTLLDTLDDLANAVNFVLAQRGFPTHPVESYKMRVGEGVVRLVSQSVPPGLSPEQVEPMVAAYRARYGQTWNVHTKPYAGIAELLDGLQRRGVKLAVLSNKPDEFTQLCVREFLPRWHFDAIVGASPARPHKPDPAGALHIAEQMKIAPGRFIYLGDSGVDMQTARAAGMYAVGALWGFRQREELERNGAQALVRTPPELLTRLD